MSPWIADADRLPTSAIRTQPFTHIPDTATKVVLRLGADGRRDTLVVGPRTRATYHVDDGVTSCVQLRLQPGAAPRLLGVSAADLVNRVVPLAELPDDSALRAAFADVDPDADITELDSMLSHYLPAVPRTDRTDLVRNAVYALSSGPVQVQRLARQLAVSERLLRTAFADGIGVSPKHFARIDRVRHILSSGSDTPLAELAASTGYYDQSHMTADFRSLMGVPPASYFTGRLPTAGPCQFQRAADRRSE